jgi:ribonuclease-3
LTKEPALARFAAELDLGTCLLLGKGEELTGGRERPSNLADAFEAVLGALYLDGGWDAAEILCRPFVQECLREPERVLRAENPKGALQELTLSRFQSTPDYVTVTVSGPVHAPSYEVKVLINGQCFGQALAGSRKAAEKAAAREALAKLLTDAGDEPPHDEKLAEQEG